MVYQRATHWLRWRLARLVFRCLLILGVLLALGCGSSDGLNRQAISGTVTLDGQPIATGAILFEPVTQQSGTAVGATIRQGKFAISRSEGPVPGNYMVRVYSSLDVQAPPAPGQTDRSPRPMVERFPPCYNTRTELRAQVLDRSVNRFPFNLNSNQTTDLR